MADYTLYYWSVPFRGQFVRAVLAFAGRSWDEVDDGAIAQMMEGPLADMPVPFMGPPVLIDQASGFAIAQMPAIILYLGETLNLLPPTPALRALTLKVVNDANDVIDELSRDGGRDMWTEARWQQFVPRLEKWMSLWEETARRHGVEAERGYLLGSKAPGIADVVTATLWTTMIERFDRVADIFADAAPLTAALAQRVSALPTLMQVAEQARQDYGEDYCGGQIGQSMARVLNAKTRG